MGFFDFFRKEGRSSETSADSQSGDRPTRHSSGLGELTKLLSGKEALNILDLGPTSPSNISLLTGLGHRVYNEDVLLASFDPAYATQGEDGAKQIDVANFLSENLSHGGQRFDVVLCWDVPDYLHESLVKVLVERLAAVMKPGGVLLAFFHTKDAGPDAPYYRYHIAGKNSLSLQRGPQFRLQRVFNNRHIENLFKDFSNIKFFLARDNVREVLVVR
ncbi:MAG TPA: methyltransferase domain-containing protein [Terriglobales bacterium]|nr:methyltransferase domain-containing protein [Terriglobales bacterium]